MAAIPIVIGIIACLLLQGKASAQVTLISPSLTARNWVSSSSLIDGINTAMIDIDTGDSPNDHGIITLAGCAYYGSGGANPGGIVVTDLNSGYSVNVYYTALAPMTSTPDIIIGNNISSATPTLDFIMAVAYINNSANVQIDYYDIHFTGPGVFTVTYNTNSVVANYGSYLPLRTVHMDVVASRTAPPLYNNRPVCDTFVIVFDGAWSGVGTNNVFATFGSLNSYSVLASTSNIVSSVWPADNMEPDVAGIQIHAGSNVDDGAYITWVDQGRIPLFWLKWDIITGSVLGGNYTSVCTGCTYYNPRIDANDDYLTNNISTNANYKVGVQYYNPGTGRYNVATYDSKSSTAMTASATWIDPTFSYGISPYNHYAPAVAFGPNTSQQYMVTECNHVISGIPTASDFYLMMPIDEGTSSSLAPDPTIAGQYDYFLVNQYPPVTNAVPTGYANSVSTPCNNVADTNLVAWTYYNGTNYNIDFKTTLYAPSATPGYNYRKSPNLTPALSMCGDGVIVYPNPATDHITISNPASNSADEYNVTNMLGQTVLQGCLIAGVQDIAVSQLADGSYVISLYKQGTEYGNHIFVKNK
jgi:type IX secretion system substrate protein